MKKIFLKLCQGRSDSITSNDSQASSNSRYSNLIDSQSKKHRPKNQERTSRPLTKSADSKVAENSTVDPFSYFERKVKKWPGAAWKNILNFPKEQMDSCCNGNCL